MRKKYTLNELPQSVIQLANTRIPSDGNCKQLHNDLIRDLKTNGKDHGYPRDAAINDCETAVPPILERVGFSQKNIALLGKDYAQYHARVGSIATRACSFSYPDKTCIASISKENKIYEENKKVYHRGSVSGFLVRPQREDDEARITPIEGTVHILYQYTPHGPKFLELEIEGEELQGIFEKYLERIKSIEKAYEEYNQYLNQKIKLEMDGLELNIDNLGISKHKVVFNGTESFTASPRDYLDRIEEAAQKTPTLQSNTKIQQGLRKYHAAQEMKKAALSGDHYKFAEAAKQNMPVLRAAWGDSQAEPDTGCLCFLRCLRAMFHRITFDFFKEKDTKNREFYFNTYNNAALVKTPIAKNLSAPDLKGG